MAHIVLTCRFGLVQVTELISLNFMAFSVMRLVLRFVYWKQVGAFIGLLVSFKIAILAIFAIALYSLIAEGIYCQLHFYQLQISTSHQPNSILRNSPHTRSRIRLPSSGFLDH